MNAEAIELEYLQPVLDAKSRLIKALASTSSAEIAAKVIKYNEAEVNLRTEARLLHQQKRLPADTNVEIADLLNSGLPLVGEAMAKCWKDGYKIYG